MSPDMHEVYRTPTAVILQGDACAGLRTLPDQSVAAILTDPPYDVGLAAWDQAIDKAAFSQQVQRVVDKNGFYAVFGQFPTVVTWYHAALAVGMTFLECVVWLKRNATPGVRLSRGYEVIFLFAVGTQRRFYQTRGPFEDVKLPGVLVDAVTFDGIYRHIHALRTHARTGHDDGTPRKPGRDMFTRYGSTTRSRCPDQVNFTNVWSFLPPRYARRTQTDLHPTAKPVAVMERLVEMCSQPGDLVLDPFFGGGTTGEAALRLGRRVLGIEHDATFAAQAHARLLAVQRELHAARRPLAPPRRRGQEDAP